MTIIYLQTITLTKYTCLERLKTKQYENIYINLLLNERQGRTGQHWPEVVTVRTEHREVRTKTTEGQYSPVRLEQARLVSSLLYGTWLMLYTYIFSNALPVS